MLKPMVNGMRTMPKSLGHLNTRLLNNVLIMNQYLSQPDADSRAGDQMKLCLNIMCPTICGLLLNDD